MNNEQKLLRIASISFKSKRRQASKEELKERCRLLQELGINLKVALKEAEQVILQKM